MPLPKPKAGESLADFLEYCPFDPEMEIEFGTVEQRFAVCRTVYEDAQKNQKALRITTQKIKRDDFIKAWDRQIKIAENREFKKWFAYFKRENFKGVDEFIATGKITGFDGLFLDRDITDLYINLFSSVGTQIALWYQNNFEKYIVKQQSQANWRETFAAFGQRFAADKVTLVSGNRKKELQGVLKRLMTDPDFQSLNERQAQRILRNQFTGYSRNQAMRLVRTESTTAANYAATQTANDLFGSDGYEKEWLTAIDGRERPAHREANGQRVAADQPFYVGGEYLRFPSDPSASAKNRINCRCTILTMPLGAVEEIEERQTGGLVSELGFGLEGSERISVGAEIAEIIGQNFATREVIEEATETLRDIKIKEYIAKNKPDNWDEINEWAFKDSGIAGQLNDEFLELVEKDSLQITAVRKAKSSYHNQSRKEIVFNTHSPWKYRDITVYHEYGHHIHDAHNVFETKLWLDYYKKVKRDLGVGLRGQNKIDAENRFKDIIPDISSFKGYIRYTELRDKELYELIPNSLKTISKEEAFEQYSGIADFIGAVTKEKYGFGHGKAYYTKKGIYRSHAEVFAHISEWRYGKNQVVKELFPELYEEAMKFYDEMVEIIRKERGY